MNKEQLKQQAIALSYNPNEPAPKVIASGQGYLADKIISRATEENIPIHKDEKLADSLSNIELGEYIPKELYKIVADVLLFVDNMDRIKGKNKEDEAKSIRGK